PVELFTEMRSLLDRSLAIRTYSIHVLDVDRSQRRALMVEAIALMADGRVRAAPVLPFALEDACLAHTLLDEGPLGKIALMPRA
ncbi:MAG: alcohol dehydrogenase, partial [Caldimonas sp.]